MGWTHRPHWQCLLMQYKLQCAVLMRIKRTAGWDETRTNPLTIWDHNRNLKENQYRITSVWNATGQKHLFLFSHLFIYLLIVSSEPLWRRQSWVCPLERDIKCSAHPLDGPQLLTRSQKSVQMVHFSAPSFSLPCSRFLLWTTHLLVLCFQKRTTTHDLVSVVEMKGNSFCLMF